MGMYRKKLFFISATNHREGENTERSVNGNVYEGVHTANHF